MLFFRKKKKPQPPLLLWEPVAPQEVPRLESPVVGVFSGRDEAWMWVRGGDAPIPDCFPRERTLTLTFPSGWVNSRLVPGGWPFFRYQKPETPTQGWVDPLITQKFFSFPDQEVWSIQTPQSWRFLRFFFPFYQHSGAETFRLVPVALGTEGSDRWGSARLTHWKGGAGVAFGVGEEGAGVLDALVQRLGTQMAATRLVPQPPVWQSVIPKTGAAGVTIYVRVLTQGQNLTGALFLSYALLVEAAGRFLPPEIKGLNKDRPLSSLALVHLLKEALSEPAVILEDRARIPLTMTFGELLPWLGPVDRRRFLEVLVFGRHGLRELKGLTSFRLGKKILPDPAFSPDLLVSLLNRLRREDWQGSSPPAGWTLAHLQEGNRRIFKEILQRLNGEKDLLSPWGQRVLLTLWGQVEHRRFQALVQRWARDPLVQKNFLALPPLTAQNLVYKTLDRDWGYLLKVLPEIGSRVRTLMTRRRWRRVQEEAARVSPLTPWEVEEELWMACRRFGKRLDSLMQGRSSREAGKPLP